MFATWSNGIRFNFIWHFQLSYKQSEAESQIRGLFASITLKNYQIMKFFFLSASTTTLHFTKPKLCYSPSSLSNSLEHFTHFCKYHLKHSSNYFSSIIWLSYMNYIHAIFTEQDVTRYNRVFYYLWCDVHGTYNNFENSWNVRYYICGINH